MMKKMKVMAISGRRHCRGPSSYVRVPMSEFLLVARRGQWPRGTRN
jgi:hypothetical protein